MFKLEHFRNNAPFVNKSDIYSDPTAAKMRNSYSDIGLSGFHGVV
jgi:hypothetical protein